MYYRYLKTDEEVKIWKDGNKHEWEYLTEKVIEKFDVTPTDIIGDIGLVNDETGNVLQYEEQEIFIQPFRMRLNNNEEIVGYIPCEDENGQHGYIRILKKRSRKWLIPVIMTLLLLVGGGVWYLMNQNDDFLDEAAISYQMPNGIKNTDPEQITVPVLTDLTWKKGEDTIEAAFANPDGNPCYFRYIVKLADTDEVIYESKYIEPGTAIMEFRPTKQLSSGKYTIEISVKTVSLNDRESEMNGGAMDCNLTVE